MKCGKSDAFHPVGRIRAKVLLKARSAIILPLLAGFAAHGSMLATDESGIYNKAEAMGYINVVKG